MRRATKHFARGTGRVYWPALGGLKPLSLVVPVLGRSRPRVSYIDLPHLMLAGNVAVLFSITSTLIRPAPVCSVLEAGLATGLATGKSCCFHVIIERQDPACPLRAPAWCVWVLFGSPTQTVGVRLPLCWAFSRVE